jgi:hypothetical protein
MKHLIFICFVALTTACCGLAINANAAGAKTEAHDSRTIEGCLSKTGDIYILTGGSHRPMQFRVDSNDTSWLKDQVGHTIKVVGTVTENNASANQNEPYNAGSTTGAGYLIVHAQKMTEVASNCSYPG